MAASILLSDSCIILSPRPTIEKDLNPEGIILIMKARHLCKEMRGVKKNNGEMITVETRGVFKENDKKRKEFMDIIFFDSELRNNTSLKLG